MISDDREVYENRNTYLVEAAPSQEEHEFGREYGDRSYN